MASIINTISKACKCTSHDQWSTPDASPDMRQIYNIQKSKKIKASVVAYSKLHSYLGPRATCICKCCIVKIETIMSGVSSFKRSKLKESLLELIYALETASIQEISTISDDVWAKLTYQLGIKIVNKQVKDDGESIASEYNSVQYLRSINPKSYIFDRNNILLSFIEGLSGMDFNSDLSIVKYYSIALAIENIYKLRNFQLDITSQFYC